LVVFILQASACKTNTTKNRKWYSIILITEQWHNELRQQMWRSPGNTSGFSKPEDRWTDIERQIDKWFAPKLLYIWNQFTSVGNYAVIRLGHSVSLAPRARKEYSYISTPFLGNYGMFYFERYLLSARKVRRSLLQYIMQSTAVVLIAVLAADISGRTVPRWLLTVLVREVLVVP
jgi:hypothetical protein